MHVHWRELLFWLLDGWARVYSAHNLLCSLPFCLPIMLPSLPVHRERWEDRIAWDAKQAAQKLRCLPSCTWWSIGNDAEV